MCFFFLSFEFTAVSGDDGNDRAETLVDEDPAEEEMEDRLAAGEDGVYEGPADAAKVKEEANEEMEDEKTADEEGVVDVVAEEHEVEDEEGVDNPDAVPSPLGRRELEASALSELAVTTSTKKMMKMREICNIKKGLLCDISCNSMLLIL